MLTVLFEDNHLLVVDKPPGLLTQASVAGDDTVLERAKAYLKARWQKPGNVFVGLVHRLDRSTSGVLVLAKTSKAASRLAEQLRAREGFEKTYLAIVHGRLASARSLRHHLAEVGDGVRVFETAGAQTKPAELEVRALDVGAAETLVEVLLGTGRKHQIRAQLAAIGHPIAGDRRYGAPASGLTAPRVMLHAWRLAVIHPVTRARIAWEAPIPEDFRRVLGRAGLVFRAPQNE